MLRELLSLGDKIDIRLMDRKGKPMSGVGAFVSQLIDFAEVDILHIAAPIYAGKTLFLEAGKTYNLVFYTNKGLYQCNCSVLGSHKDNNIIVMVVRIITPLEKFQRRQYYRLELIQDIEYRLVTLEEEALDKKLAIGSFASEQEWTDAQDRLRQFDKEWLHASMTDLSGGGAKFTSEQQYNKGDRLRIKLDFIYETGPNKLVLQTRVISSNRIMARVGAYEHRVEFTDIMQKEREALIKYIFEQERKRRRNEKT